MGSALTWSAIEERLAGARNYWLHTTSIDGSPHAVPVWGAVHDGRLYLYSERSTAKAANIARDPRVVLHLPEAEDVLIVHGRLADLGRPHTHPAVLAALDDAYPDEADRIYLPSTDPSFDVLWVLRPERARAWRLDDWEASQGLWRADRDTPESSER
jgi:general stress protein 26